MRAKVKKLILVAPLAFLGMLLFAAIGGELVKLLWNWLLPTLFGWRPITFWQAVGILALCRILFGRSGIGRGVRSRSGRRMAERWQRMTPEEREQFRERFWGRRYGAPPDSTPAP